eukprot:TRINITY_DN15856_c0_g1_i2.p1 TRINITY_DN15856_c0_g1~~TRINITY_DN15856_c0_g1_i2.p1  ORF type:complete len:504 (+),score=98.31 TRINITY_DN15856_c0_g1_i2:80-1591(+)
MPIARRPTPPSSQAVKHHAVLSSLSAWTDQGDADDEASEVASNTKRLSQHDDSKRSRCPLPDVESDKFNFVIGVVIVSNAALIGVETDFGRDNILIAMCESLFNFIFLTEFLLRFRQFGRQYFKEAWNIFDLTLVLIGTADLWIIPLFLKYTGGAASPDSQIGYELSAMRLLRILRLMRVLRVIRLFRMFQQLHLIMQAFQKAAQIVCIMGLIIGILDYVLAIMLTQGIGQHASDYGQAEDLVRSWFGDIPTSMRTLFLIMTLSRWDVIPPVLTRVLPETLVIACFVLYIMIASYTMMSLITGIISESLITSQADYKWRKLRIVDKKRKALASEVMYFLTEVLEDSLDEQGAVAAEDLKTFVRGDPELLKGLAEVDVSVTESGILSLVDNMSRNGQDRVSVAFFVDKLTNLTGAANASAVADLRYEVSKIDQQFLKIEKKVKALCVHCGADTKGINSDVDTTPTAAMPEATQTSGVPEVNSAGHRSSFKSTSKPRAKLQFAED